jgi:tetratricopeptide (TPR) repeat protein
MAPESPAATSEQRPPRVFLSYSHDSFEHAARVLALAQQLRRDGVDSRIDQFEAFPPQGWPQWCAREILDARYVLLVCTETYRRRFFGYEQAGVGRGVKWEANIVQNILYNDERNLRFVPMVFAKEDEQFIPETLQGGTRILLNDCKPSDAGYKSLLRHFTGGKKLPPLAKISRIAEPQRSPDASVPTEQVWEEATAIVIQKLDEIQAEQKEHEWKSAERHRELLAIVADPVILRARLEDKIDESFEHKRAKLLRLKARPAEIDALYRWCDRVKGQVGEVVAFITARAGDPNSPIIKTAAAIVKERGVDAALEFLDATLKSERQRRKEEGRQFAEASVMKAEMHAARLETDEQERAIRDAIADAPDWFEPHNNLGIILLDRAEWQLAEQEFETARKAMPADAEGTVLGNLAVIYLATSRLAEAEPLLERALKIDEKSFGPEHPSVARSLNNLAQLYQDTNRAAEAEPLMERALKMTEKILGPEDPHVAIYLSNLGELYYATNRLAEAEPLLERALKMNEKVLGPEHPKVAISLDNLALLYQDTNRLAEAELLMKRATSIFEKSYGPEHPSVARNLANLARLYQDTNRQAEAEPLLERGLKIDEKSFGPEQPNVAIRLGKLAHLYQDTNRLAEAEPLLERALKIDEKILGPEDPNVAIDVGQLAAIYFATNRLAEAEPLAERCLVILLQFTRKTGHPHPYLGVAINNYTGLLGMMFLPEAEQAQRLVEAVYEAGYTPKEFIALRQQLSASISPSNNPPD